MGRRLIAVLVVAVAGLLALTSGCELLPVTRQTGMSATVTTQSSPIQPGFTIPSPSAGGVPVTLPSVADVVAKVKPSVVAINVEVPGQDIFGRTYTQSGAGSGWIIDPTGIIVTNNHVVEGASKVTVVLDDGRSFSADPRKIATDPLADLAVVKIDASGLPAATVGDSSKLRVGDFVVAIGNSLGQGIRATLGIVSQKDVSIEVDSGQTLYGLIETDAAINPGNSGGPLVNMAGEVIGINSVKIAQVGVEGVGYAIGSGEASPIIQQLVNVGYVVRPFLGVRMADVVPAYTARYGLAVDSGALIIEVVPGSPAASAGLQPGDVITGFAGKEIKDTSSLRQAIQRSKIGDRVEITYWRGNRQFTAAATLISNAGQ